MQLNGNISKLGLPKLLELAKDGGLTGRIVLEQGVHKATIYVEEGRLVHVESDSQIGRDALMELFLWSQGSFTFVEGDVGDVPGTFPPNEPVERIVDEGLEYVEQKRFLDRLGVSGKTVLRLTPAAEDADLPLLEYIDGERTLAQVLAGTRLSRRAYVANVYTMLSKGLAVVAYQAEGKQANEAPAPHKEANQKAAVIKLPDWVTARLLLDNSDISQAIVDLVVWADKVKIWMYQTDADLSGVIAALSDETSGGGKADDKDEAELSEPSKPGKRQSKLSSLIAEADAPEADSQ